MFNTTNKKLKNEFLLEGEELVKTLSIERWTFAGDEKALRLKAKLWYIDQRKKKLQIELKDREKILASYK